MKIDIGDNVFFLIYGIAVLIALVTIFLFGNKNN